MTALEPDRGAAPVYAAALRAAPDLESVQRLVTTTARRLVLADGVTFVLRDGDYCFYADEDAMAPLWKGQRFPIRECVSGWAMLTRRSATIVDVRRDPRVPVDAYRPTFVRSMVMVPVDVERPVAAIGAYWAIRRHRIPEREVVELEQLAALTAEAITAVGLENAPWAPSFRPDVPPPDHGPEVPAQRRR